MKEKNTLTKIEEDYKELDPIDGYKAVGCLFAGVLILLILLYSLKLLINFVRL
jgi:hypothetical protein